MWIFGGKRLIVTKFNGKSKQIIPRLQPLSGGTVHQIYGYESPIVGVEAVVVGKANLNHWLSLTTSGVSFPFTDYEGDSLGDFLVSNVGYEREYTVSQSIDTDEPCDAPVFKVTFELYQE